LRNLKLIWENTAAGQSGAGQELMESVERLIQEGLAQAGKHEFDLNRHAPLRIVILDSLFL
jgi:hypothetical protein